MMLIHDQQRLGLLEYACQELADNRDCVPGERFYDQRRRTVWDHARTTRAYGGLGEYSSAAFFTLDPTLKSTLKAQPLEFLAAGLADATKYYETSGTTGAPTPTPRLAEDMIWNSAAVCEAWRPLFAEDDRVAILMPSDLVPVGDLIVSVCELLELPHVRAYPFATGISDWDRILEVWQTLRPTAVVVAPGAAIQFTRLLKRRGVLDDVAGTIGRLLLLGEVNTPALRRRLGQWWGADVYDASYGSTETGTLAASCDRGNQHLLTTTNYCELSTPEGLTTPTAGAAGTLVVTPLHQQARPLLRLDTGDQVAVSATGCPCGRPTPTITVQGRAQDAMLVHGAPLTTRAVEEVVYSLADTTGYLIETDSDGTLAGLILERDVVWERAAEPALIDAIQDRSRETMGLAWDRIDFVNALPPQTKSGAAQKNWKRSNFRILETPA
jgi:phenylacetate-CoA ligase